MESKSKMTAELNLAIRSCFVYGVGGERGGREGGRVGGREGGKGYSQKNWMELCGQLPKILTLFMTKIYDFPHPT